MRGNFGARRQTLKQRLQSLRDQNARLAKRDQGNRCAECKAAITGQAFMVFGRPERWCSAKCLPAVSA